MYLGSDNLSWVSKSSRLDWEVMVGSWPRWEGSSGEVAAEGGCEEGT